MKSLTKLTILLAVLVLLAACAPSAPPPESTEPPAAEATSVPEPTEEPEPTLEGFIVNFYGDSCDSTSPDVLSEGQHAFRLNDVEGTTKPDLYIIRLTDGHTFQDLLDPQEEPGDSYPAPDWVVAAQKMGSVDPDTGERAYRFTLTPGEHAIYVSNWRTPSERGLWFCEPLEVVEATP